MVVCKYQKALVWVQFVMYVDLTLVFLTKLVCVYLRHVIPNNLKSTYEIGLFFLAYNSYMYMDRKQ